MDMMTTEAGVLLVLVDVMETDWASFSPHCLPAVPHLALNCVGERLGWGNIEALRVMTRIEPSWGSPAQEFE